MVNFMSAETRGAKPILTVERFYSDPEVVIVLHNLHMLMLKKKGIEETDGSGDGTGYSLTVKVNYESHAQKFKEKIKTNDPKPKGEGKKTKFIFSFALMDIRTRMYVGYGTSLKSEKDAYNAAIKMAKESGIIIK